MKNKKKNQYQPKSSSQSQMLLRILFFPLPTELFYGMIAGGWEYILAAKIFHPKRKRQRCQSISSWWCERESRFESGPAATLRSLSHIVSFCLLFFFFFCFWCFRLHCGWLSTQARQGRLSAVALFLLLFFFLSQELPLIVGPTCDCTLAPTCAPW